VRHGTMKTARIPWLRLGAFLCALLAGCGPGAEPAPAELAAAASELAAAPKPQAKERFVRVFGTGAGKPAEFVPKAAAAGVTDLFVAGSPKYLADYVTVAQKHGLRVWAWVAMNCNTSLWKAKYPNDPPPLQGLNDEETKSLERLRKNDPAALASHQWGGEPTEAGDLFPGDMLSFHDPRVMELLKDSIRTTLAVPGLTGLFLDGWGYQNLRCDRSPQAMEAFAAYQAKHPGADPDKAFQDFSLEALVTKHNELAAFARSVRPDILLSDHVWPAYAPMPLYGNRLDLDLCGQTAAWYSEWPLDKVERYAREIVADEAAFHAKARGVAFLGYYNRPGKFPQKSAARLEAELKAILAGGCDCLMIHSLPELLAVPETAAMLTKYAAATPPAAAAAESRPLADEPGRADGAGPQD